MQKLHKVTLSLVVGSLTLGFSGPVSPALGQDPETVFGSGKTTAPSSAARSASNVKSSAAKSSAAKSSAAKSSAAKSSAAKSSAAKSYAAEPSVSAKSSPAAQPSAAAGGQMIRAKAAPVAATMRRAASGPSHAVSAASAAPSRAQRERVSAPAASPAQVRAYCGKLWNKIQNNWELATGKNHVIVSIDVDAGGNVFATKVSSTPQNADAEAKAQAAVTKSQPLEALPAGLPSAHLTVTFDSSSDPHGDATSNGSVRLEYHPGSTPGVATPADPERKETEKADTAAGGANAAAAAPPASPVQAPANPGNTAPATAPANAAPASTPAPAK